MIEFFNAVDVVAITNYIVQVNIRRKAERQNSNLVYPNKKSPEIVESLAQELEQPVTVIDLIESKNYNLQNKDEITRLVKALKEVLADDGSAPKSSSGVR